MTHRHDGDFLQALILGEANALAPDALARLMVLRAQYSGTGDAGMGYLVQRAVEVRSVALTRAALAGDRGYLESLTGDNWTEDVVAEVSRLPNARWPQVEKRAAELMRYPSIQ